MMKLAVVLMMVGACLAYPTGEETLQLGNPAPENVQIVPVPNQPIPVGPEAMGPAPLPAGPGPVGAHVPMPGQGQIPEQGNTANPEGDLKTDSSLWWGRSYYPVVSQRSYSYYPRSYTYYRSYPSYSYWSPSSYWW